MARKLKDALELGRREIISLVGGGGKTTLLYWLAEELRQQGVILTTSTKMWYPPPAVPLILWQDPEQVKIELKARLAAGQTPLLAAADLPQLEKVAGLNQEQLRELAGWGLPATIVIEADGAKGRPLKGYRDFEPVLTPTTSLLLQVVGADAIGQRLSDRFAHCPEKIAAGAGLQMGAPLDTPSLAAALLYPHRSWEKVLPGVRKIAVVNKVDLLDDITPAQDLARKLLESGYFAKALLTGQEGYFSSPALFLSLA
ncbi:MAG: putative selenium-dependent hydroxylase accessory protein YqeC [Firmicutes bacterium]|nr:putative selenium-dependent hydroxylase accessory protein YqeC [Bacillota bacterium]